MHYWLFVGTSKTSFESNTPSAGYVGNGKTEGRPGILVNGNLCSWYSGGAEMRGITPYLTDGQNDLTVEGRHPLAIYIHVARSPVGHPDPKNTALNAKQSFAPDQKPAPHLLFLATIPKLPKFDPLPTDQRQREAARPEVEALVKQIIEAIANHAGKNAARLLNAGKRIFEPALFGATPNDLVAKDREIAQLVDSPDSKLVEEQQRLEYRFGRTMVTVYRSGPEFNYSFRINAHGKEQSLGPLHIVRISGQWLVWD